MVEFIMASIIVERVTEMVKDLFPDGRGPNGLYISTALGVVFSVCYGLDLPEAFGFVTAIPILGNVLTGFLISGGSAGMNAILEALQGAAVPKVEEEFDDITISG